MKQYIVTNKITCVACGDTITSTTTHDFKMCICGLVGVDGGKDYLKRIGVIGNYVEMSTFTTVITYRELKAALEKLTDEQLDHDVTVYDATKKEIYPSSLEIVKDKEGNDEILDLLDNGHAYLKIIT